MKISWTVESEDGWQRKTGEIILHKYYDFSTVVKDLSEVVSKHEVIAAEEQDV